MIVKNEQDWIDGAVASVRSIIDQVIIVDTGSTDATRDHAKNLGATLLLRQWTGSFAEARNIALEAAAEPWILVLDADERIASRDLPFIKEAAESNRADGYHLIQRNYVFKSQVFGWTPNTGEYDEGAKYAGYVDNPLIRFFRNSPAIRFQGVVHEIIDPNRLPSHLKFDSLPAVMHHYGKVRGDEYVAAKQQFYLDLGLKKVAQDGSGKAFLDLGIQYQELNSHMEACACFDQAFEMTRNPMALLYWALSEKQLRNYESAANLLRRAIALGFDTFHVHLELGNIHLAQNEWMQAQVEYGKCLELNSESPVAAFNYGLVLRKSGDTQAAIDFYTRALRLDAKFREPMLELAVLHLQAHRPDHALRALEGAEADAVVLSLRGAAYLQKNDLEEAQSHLEGALKKDRSISDARLNLAQVYTLKGDHARAARYMQSVAVK